VKTATFSTALPLSATYVRSGILQYEEHVIACPLLWIEANRASSARFNTLGVCWSRCFPFSRFVAVVESEFVSSGKEGGTYDYQAHSPRVRSFDA